MTNNTWNKCDFDNMDAEEEKLINSIEKLKSSKSCNYQDIARAQESLSNLMAENRGIRGKKFNTAAFAEYLTKRFGAMEYSGNIYLYNSNLGIYEAVPENTIKKFMKKVLDEYSKDIWSMGYEVTYYTAFCRSIPSYKTIDDSPSLLVFKNGVLNTSSMEFYAHSPKLIKFTALPYNYDKDKQAPKFVETITDIFNGHQPTIGRKGCISRLMVANAEYHSARLLPHRLQQYGGIRL